MKKISFLPLLALVIAFAASAFTARKTTNDVWYEFTGTDYNDVDNRELYQSTESEESPGCSTAGDICAIKLPNNGTHPDADDFDALLPAIEAAQQNQSTSDLSIELQE